MTIDVKASSLTKRMTIKVRLVGLRPWIVRVKIAAWLMRLAAWVIGCQLDIELKDNL